MEELKPLGSLLTLVIGVLILMAAFYAALIVVPTLVGCVGFMMVKTKTPLVNPNGPLIVPLIYVLAWSAVISAGLFVGSLFLADGVWKVNRSTEALAKSVGPDAVAFFLESSLILLGTLGVGSSPLARRNLFLASSASCGLASVLFTFSPMPSLESFDAFTLELYRRVVSTITFPYTVVVEIAKGFDSAWMTVQRWFWATNGNLFAFGAALSKLLFVAMLVQAVRGMTSRSPDTPHERSRSLSAEEWKRFAWTLGLVALIAAAIPLVPSYPLAAVAIAGFNIVLVWNLWNARPRASLR